MAASPERSNGAREQTWPTLACGYPDRNQMGLRRIAAQGVSLAMELGVAPPLFAGVESVPSIFGTAQLTKTITSKLAMAARLQRTG